MKRTTFVIGRRVSMSFAAAVAAVAAAGGAPPMGWGEDGARARDAGARR